MKKEPNIHVREIEVRDIDLLADYWFQSSKEHLLGMGADPEKLPPRKNLVAMLAQQIATPLNEKQSYALIWELDGKAVGHTNVNQISFGKQAYMHLHLWKPIHRNKGLGTALVKHSLPYFFDGLQLEVLYCEPYALNPAPNSTLKRLGFVFVKKHITIPGSINFEQVVNLWKLPRAKYLEL
ncbi:MAG: GNAT family protein [Bacteroidota bacterium]